MTSAPKDHDLLHRPAAEPQGQEPRQPPALHPPRARANPRGGAEIAQGFRRRRYRQGPQGHASRRKGTREPRFRLDPKAGGERDFVLPGNKEFVPGDEIKKPQAGRGRRGQGSRRSGEGEDDFEFTMTPGRNPRHLLRGSRTAQSGAHGADRSAGAELASAPASPRSGSPNQINLVRTMRNSFGRRLALKRPRVEDVEALEKEIADARGESAARGWRATSSPR